MNGHKQSGGHWNAAFCLARCGSGGFGSPQESSRSGDGSASGTLLIVLDALHKSVAQPSRFAAPPEEQRAMGESRVSSFAFGYPVSLQVELLLVCSELISPERVGLLLRFLALIRDWWLNMST